MNVFGSIAETWKAGFSKFSRIPFVFILIAIEVYFWVNGNAHFPDWSAQYGDTILVYIAMTVIFVLWSQKRTQTQMKTPLQKAVPIFAMFFVGTYVILFLLNVVGVVSAEALPKEVFWQTIIMQVCVVATAEELMFRGVILEYMGILMSAILFAAWHAWAYGIRYYDFSWSSFNYLAVIFAFVIGILLGFIAKQDKFGLPAAIAIHASYNLFIVGAFFSL